MTATPPRILALVEPRPAEGGEDASRLLDDALGSVEAAVRVTDLPSALACLDRRRAEGARIVIAVIGPNVDRPLTTALELRRVRTSLHLAFVVHPSAAEAMEVRLGLMPELRGASIVVADGTVEAMKASLLHAASDADRRQGVRSALDEMNRQLLQGSKSQRGATRGSVSQSYLAALIHHVPDAIVSVDGEARIVALNDAAAALLATDRYAVEGETLFDVVGSAADELQRLVEGALSGEIRSGQEIELASGDEQPVLASFTAAPVRDHAEGIVGVVLVARDITEQRRAEVRLRELQKAQSLATLAGGVAHDFNNLLVTVNSWAELAADDIDDVDLVTTALERIRTAARRAAELARSMLVYSGRGRFEPEPVDVSGLVGEMADLLRGSVSRKARLEFELEDDLPTVEADASQLRQVVMNLITNAAEALGGEPGTITLRTCGPEATAGLRDRGRLPPGRYVAVEVADTGPGMDQRTIQRVFEPFFTTKFEGRGLGLAASDGIARAHGGALTVESEPGCGATFRMLLPTSSKEPGS